MTAAFRMDRPFSPLLWILGDRAGMIASPAVYDDFTEANSRSEPAGAGAFRFVEEDLDSPFVVEANPNYWLPNAPSIERITWFQGALQSVGNVEGLLAGDYDVVREVSIEDFGRIRDGGFTLLEEVTNFVFFYNINTNFEPWTNPHARHAWNAGFDRTALNDTVFGGYHTPALWGWYGSRRSSITTRTSASGSSTRRSCKCTLNAGGFEDGLEFNMNGQSRRPALHRPVAVRPGRARPGRHHDEHRCRSPHPAFWSLSGMRNRKSGASWVACRCEADIWQHGLLERRSRAGPMTTCCRPTKIRRCRLPSSRWRRRSNCKRGSRRCANSTASPNHAPTR